MSFAFGAKSNAFGTNTGSNFNSFGTTQTQQSGFNTFGGNNNNAAKPGAFGSFGGAAGGVGGTTSTFGTMSNAFGTNSGGTGFGAGASFGGGFGSRAGTGFGMGQGGTMAGTGWGNAQSKQQQQHQSSGFMTGQPQQPPVETPVSTIGITFEPIEVELPIKNPKPDWPLSAQFKVLHISQYEIFGKYTIDELRYYDYLRKGFIAKQQQLTSNFTTGTGQTSTMNMNAAGGMQQATQQNVPISPWRRKPEKLNPPNSVKQAQPFGALPATTLTAPQAEGEESTSTAAEVPADEGFRKTMSLFDHILKSEPSQSATPGIRQLTSCKIGKSTTSNTPSFSGFASRHQSSVAWSDPAQTGQGTDNDDDDDDDKQNEYQFIPDLKSLKNGVEESNFSVSHRIHGSIMFPMKIDVIKMNPARSIKISDRKVQVKLSSAERKSLGITDQFPSVVTLNNIFPGDKRDEKSLREYETDLEKFCHDHELGFISYVHENGSLMFTVDSLSKFPICID
ncbi:hypothetical protein TRFO_24150 [Tritrichomonas foetus]|uniref:Peptidase S59 domain-containing protein n=1 Tax=Tritrichomonas foetus TaxID=1144522 RepID=A0A1J4K826_9EUKA|nr:hypothetical protein TRFO_24150 [Tritrichomonas foetus]|eukprot:OHT07649.1 hypothetical protein TRFO_24150 [Tritrichomonas foetus]